MYKFVKDTIEVISENANDEIWGECTKIRIKETGEELLVFKKPDRVEINSQKGGSLRRAGIVVIWSDGTIVDFKVEDPYRGYGLGKYLFEKAITDYKGWHLDCNGTTAYKIYRKFDFVPVPRAWPATNKRAILAKMKSILEGEGYLGPVIRMVKRDRLSEFGLEWNEDLDRFTKYVDTHYHGAHDSGRYVFEKVSE